MHEQLANCVNSLVKESKTHYSNREIDKELVRNTKSASQMPHCLLAM